ncbi:MAG TPA: cytidine deaminase [Chloroflexota bacterium]|nr:cytidine deaminase [Chloroflexota bacterium]
MSGTSEESETRSDVDAAVVEGLVAAAWRAREAAYAPYSGFAVGAAVLAGSGNTYAGVNVESASYGLTVCAERAAVFAAVAAGERQIRAVAVVTDATKTTPPCGACRQVIWEFGQDAVVVAENRSGDRRAWSLRELLPDAFGPEQLG